MHVTIVPPAPVLVSTYPVNIAAQTVACYAQSASPPSVSYSVSSPAAVFASNDCSFDELSWVQTNVMSARVDQRVCFASVLNGIRSVVLEIQPVLTADLVLKIVENGVEWSGANEGAVKWAVFGIVGAVAVASVWTGVLWIIEGKK